MTDKNVSRKLNSFWVFAALALAALLLCFAACEQSPPGGEGEAESGFTPAPREPPANAIPIANAADLAKIGKDKAFPLSGVYKLTGNIPGITGWEPIGGDNDFTGDFYGMNNTITITSGRGGIFASLNGVTVYDLKVNVTANADGGSIGGITGYAEKSLIDGCEAEVNFTLTNGLHNASAGGIAGYMKNDATVSACTASGSITV